MFQYILEEFYSVHPHSLNMFYRDEVAIDSAFKTVGSIGVDLVENTN